MALDNYDRIKAINDVVEAWVGFGSLPFITRATISPGASWTFRATNPAQLAVLSMSRREALCGFRTLNYVSAGWTAKTIAGSANLGGSSSGDTYTYTNNDSERDVDMYVLALKGIIEEV